MTQIKKGRVVIVDDESVARMVLRQILERDGYVVSEAGSGAQLTPLMAHEDIVAIICDVSLPGEKGLAIQLRLEPELRRRKIAFVTLHGGDPLADEVGFSYLAKHQICEILKSHREGIGIYAEIIEAERLRLRGPD